MADYYKGVMTADGEVYKMETLGMGHELLKIDKKKLWRMLAA